MNLISKPRQVYLVWNHGQAQLLLKTEVHNLWSLIGDSRWLQVTGGVSYKLLPEITSSRVESIIILLLYLSVSCGTCTRVHALTCLGWPASRHIPATAFQATTVHCYCVCSNWLHCGFYWNEHVCIKRCTRSKTIGMKWICLLIGNQTCIALQEYIAIVTALFH